MKQTNNMETLERIKLGKKLDLDKKDIDQLLNDIPPRNEQPSLSLGPPWYLGGYYGTISINGFKS